MLLQLCQRGALRILYNRLIYIISLYVVSTVTKENFNKLLRLLLTEFKDKRQQMD